MKTFITLGLLVSTLFMRAQTPVEKSIPVRKGQKLQLNFDYPELIKVSTWNKQEVLIKGIVSINHGENDEAFILMVNTEGNAVTIESQLKDQEKIPKRIVVKRGEEEYYFKAEDTNDPTVKKFLDEHRHEYSYISTGVVKDIELEIFIPKGMESVVHAKYGLVEVKGFDAPLTVDSKYGGIDATIVAAAVGKVEARTQYGQILTNLDVKFDALPLKEGHRSWTEISGQLGKGPAYSLESKYGKVYLRKPQ